MTVLLLSEQDSKLDSDELIALFLIKPFAAHLIGEGERFFTSWQKAPVNFKKCSLSAYDVYI